jgi:flagellar FliJ protein
MSITSRLTAVLRARRAQETVAQGDLAKANAEVYRANARTAARSASMEDWGSPSSGSSTAYLAAVAAGRALASALTDAVAAEDAARTEAAANHDQLRAAAQRRRSVEKLVERADEAGRREELAAEQRGTDDISGARHAGGDR